jgi:hypothetical protein
LCEEDIKKGGLVAAYSFGIQGADGWGEDVARRLHIPVFEYDCFDGDEPETCPGCELQFRKQCLWSQTMVANSSVTWFQSASVQIYHTLTDFLEANRHSELADGSLLLKVDIEMAEWPVFLTMSVPVLRKFREIVVEFHNLHLEKWHSYYLASLRNILGAGFHVAHVHGNNYGGMACFGSFQWSLSRVLNLVRGGCLRKYEVPKVVEVTFVQNLGGSGASMACTFGASSVQDGSQDASNNPWMLELPNIILPLSSSA